MKRVRPLVFPFLIVALLLIAGLGIRQVLLTPGSAQEQTEFQSVEELLASRDQASEPVREQIAALVDSGQDPCALPSAQFSAVEWDLPYQDLASLVNDTDLIVTGRVTEHMLEPPREDTVAGRMLAEVRVEDVLYGTADGASILADPGGRVMINENGPAHVVGIDLDSCSDGLLLLFLNWTSDPGVFSIYYQGWAALEGGTVEAGPLNDLFEGETDAAALTSDVRRIAGEQEADGVPKGRLLCDSRRTSAAYIDPVVCPGDTVNLYRALGLDAAFDAFVLGAKADPKPGSAPRTDLPPGGDQLEALLRALDVEVTLEPLGPQPGPEDVVTLYLSSDTPVEATYTFEYDASDDIVRMPNHGQFTAPSAFSVAIQPFLTAP